MDSLIVLIPVSLLFAIGALAAFLWSLKSGQYDDIEGAASRILFDEDRPKTPKS
ncbi:MAG TPA: cbb3-type cytochrome oxidase assembly protein CcoS [Pirellulaceae bacterium]|nr:cbb3-type cytochrome oxidase assembly protein CcoS [Pirellulaceae bacterium]